MIGVRDLQLEFLAAFYRKLDALLAEGVRYRMDVAVQFFDDHSPRVAKAVLIAPGDEMPGPGAWTVYHSGAGVPAA